MEKTPLAHWSYKNDTSPTNWGELDPNYSMCKIGKEQSPINITHPETTMTTTLQEFKLNYKPTRLKLVNNGHTLQIPYDTGSIFTSNRKQYELVQFHFHAPSEHQINGSTFAMEAHLVHQSVEDRQKLAVIGLMLQIGKENPFLAKMWGRIPVLEGEVNVNDVNLNISELLPSNLDFYNYKGSLTTPPCTEGVFWVVLKTPVEVSGEQVNKFVAVFGQNARPVQPITNRAIYEIHVK